MFFGVRLISHQFLLTLAWLRGAYVSAASSLAARIAAAIACFAILGCGSDRPELVPVTGLVTLDGTPLTTGRIEFFPISGRPAYGAIGGDGRYELTSYEQGDGAPPGSYVVTVTARQDVVDGPVYASIEDEMRGKPISNQQGAGPSRPRWLAPSLYANRSTTTLAANVGDGSEINFELKSKPR